MSFADCNVNLYIFSLVNYQEVDCWVYHIAAAGIGDDIVGKDEDYAWLAEIRTPDDLYMRSGRYTGPRIQTWKCFFFFSIGDWTLYFGWCYWYESDAMRFLDLHLALPSVYLGELL